MACIVAAACAAGFAQNAKPGAEKPRLARPPQFKPGILRDIAKRGRGQQAVEIPAGALTLSIDQDAERWLSKARQAAERGDWKLAVDTLWRVIDQHGRSMVHDERGGVQSAAECVWRGIASWPAEGREVYESVHGPEASRLFSDAERSLDLEGLRRVARRYRWTRAGAAALERVAALALDQGLASEAADALETLESLPNPPLPRWKLLLRRAVAERAAGRQAEALAILRSLRQPDEDAPADARVPESESALLATVTEYVQDRDAGLRARSRDTWPLPMGGGDCRAWNDALSPSADAQSPWRVSLPGTESIAASRIADLCVRHGLGPIWQLVTDGQRLYVRCPAGVLALDATTFDVAWEAAVRPTERASTAGASFMPIVRGDSLPQFGVDYLDAESLRVLADEIGGMIGLGAGLVFVVEEPREWREGSAVFRQLGGRQWAVVQPFGSEPVENSLLAFEARTGKLAWMRGVGGPPTDGLVEAHFFCVPVECGDRLVAPYLAGTDLGLAVFGSDGALVERVSLGSAPTELFPRKGVLQPTCVDGELYLGTGVGTVLALSADDLSVRWVARYTRGGEIAVETNVLPPGKRGIQVAVESAIPPGWASCAPIVAGGMVIVAPPDSPSILALDRRTGETLWQVAREKGRYLIGCDDERLYVGGAAIRALRLSDGKRVWTCDGMDASGRGALCGGHVIVPTVHGLMTIDAASGQVVSGAPDSSARRVMGNLVAHGGSLYSVTADALERIPDLARSIEETEKQLSQRPRDAAVLLRLATLESLRGDVDRASSLLEQARSGVRDGHESDTERIDDQIDHLWIEMQLARAAEAADAERIDLLQAAALAARRPSDRLRAGMMLAEAERSRGARMAAVRRYVDLVQTAGGEATELEPGLSATACVAIGERLERLWRELAEGERDTARTEILERTAGRSTDGLARLCDGLGDTPVGAAADIAWGRRLRREGEIEAAAFEFRRAAERAGSEHRALAAEAFAGLVEVYLDPPAGIAPRPDLAVAELRRLRDGYPNESLRDASGAAVPVGMFVADWARRLPGGSIEAYLSERAAVPDFASWAVVGQRVSPMDAERVAAYRVSPGGSQRENPAAILKLSNQIVGIDLAGALPAAETWSTDLETSGYGWQIQQRMRMSSARSPRNERYAVSGLAAAVSVDGMIYRVGIPSGRVLGPPLVVNPAMDDRPEPPVVSVGGYFVFALNGHTLAAVTERGGGGPAWVRDLGEDVRIERLFVGEEHVVATDDLRGSAYVLRASSGRLQARIGIGSGQRAVGPGDTATPAPAVVESMVCSGETTAVKGWHAASGRSVWRQELPAAVVSIRPLGEAHIGVTCGESKFAVLESQTGRIMCVAELTDTQLPPAAAAIDSGQLLLFVRAASDSDAWQLAAFDAATGAPLWSRGGMLNAFVNDRMLVEGRSVIPVVEVMRFESSARSDAPYFPNRPDASQTTARVVFVDKTSGNRVGAPISLSGEGGLIGGLVQDVIMSTDRMLLVTTQGYAVIGGGTIAPPSNRTGGLPDAGTP